jgi:hypothetical protein
MSKCINLEHFLPPPSLLSSIHIYQMPYILRVGITNPTFVSQPTNREFPTNSRAFQTDTADSRSASKAEIMQHLYTCNIPNSLLPKYLQC